MYHHAPPAPPSTRMLTTTKWITVVVSVLLTAVATLRVVQMHDNVKLLERYDGVASRASGDGKGLKGGAEAIAYNETLIIVMYVTVAAIALLGVCALLTATGRQWPRVLCVLLMLGPMGVVVHGALEGGSNTMWGLVFLVPFLALMVLWCLPGVSRGLAVKRAARARPMPPPAAWQPRHPW
ncbi:hypothetical protein [Actinophytocola gossypii]|uniref:Uncharacterized protein n=1 Tax=Actinophytocola gossypii TaxID=2812003 RepID=A0ABT2J551_9PSEU|nr:hypothetical protein [Actinophytocola gossypii]MCT2582724.1 hypothetical protein [Actinophytocola gossypii]